MAELEFLTLYILCAKTFVYTWNDDVLTTVTPYADAEDIWQNELKAARKQIDELKTREADLLQRAQYLEAVSSSFKKHFYLFIRS